MADETELPPISFNRQLVALDVGDTVTTSKFINRATSESYDIPAVKARMRSSINPAVSKAQKRHDRVFRTDTGEFLTVDGHVVVVSAVTRMS